MQFDKKKSNKFKKNRICRFCANHELQIDYKNPDELKKYISETGKIEPRRLTGTCAKHQRRVTIEIKKARQMALLQYLSD
jgi:small subunit ribosomal protein S18